MVQYTDVQEEEGAWGMLEGRSMPSWKFSDEMPPGSGNYVPKNPGFTLQGVLKEMPQQRQAMDYTTKQPKFYKDNKPIMEIVLTMDTPERLDADDDGSRRWYLNGHARRALQDEMKRLGIKRFGIGTVITATIAGFKPNPNGRASMLFDIKLQPTAYVPVNPAVEQAMAGNAVDAAGWAQVPGVYPPTQQTGPSPVSYQQAMQQAPQPQAQQYQQPQVQQYQQQIPQQQYVQPAAPQPPQVDYAAAQQQFAAQQAQAQQQVAAQYQQVAPQQTAPQPPPVTVYAPQNGQLVAQPAGTTYAQAQQMAQAAPQQAPAAPQGGGMVVLSEHVDQVNLLMTTAGINRQTAIQAVADSVASGNAEFLALLDSNIPF